MSSCEQMCIERFPAFLAKVVLHRAFQLSHASAAVHQITHFPRGQLVLPTATTLSSFCFTKMESI